MNYLSSMRHGAGRGPSHRAWYDISIRAGLQIVLRLRTRLDLNARRTNDSNRAELLDHHHAPCHAPRHVHLFPTTPRKNVTASRQLIERWTALPHAQGSGSIQNTWSPIIIFDAHPAIHLRVLGFHSPIEQIHATKLSKPVDFDSSNPRWRLDISAKMCARFISRLFSHLRVPLASPQLDTAPYLALLVADSPSGTYLSQNHLISTAGDPSQKLSHRFFSGVTTNWASDDIATTPADHMRYNCLSEFEIFLHHCSAFRFNKKSDYLYLRHQGGYALDQSAQGLSNSDDKPVPRTAAGHLAWIVLPSARPITLRCVHQFLCSSSRKFYKLAI
ncbi:hypothetical protein BDV93DRAFT_585358 [Ceratobasidium sp. AG-I]|nr:hypothetical protein BDV93DRAFT_585358 [Ceratobasidium sp. AG-I]